MDGVVLFADNKIFSEGNENALFKKFIEKRDFSVLPIDNLACLEATIKSSSTFKACIIDWNFENEENDEDFEGVELPQRNPLSILIDNTIYSLIYIYSEIDISAYDKQKLKEKYGEKLCFRIKGNDINNEYQSISDGINDFEKNNVHMRIPFIWSQSINQSVQAIFSELESADPYWINEIRDTISNDGGNPASEIINVFHNLLNECLIQDVNLRENLNKDLLQKKVLENNALKGDDNVDPDKQDDIKQSTAKLYRRIFYSIITENSPLMTGDIFKFDDDTYGIIITPECDLSNSGKEKEKKYYDFLIVYKSLSEEYQKDKQKKYKKDTKSTMEIFNNGVISRHILISFPFEEQFYNQIGMIDFNTAFRTIIKIDKNGNHIIGSRTKYKLNVPYIHQLRQRFVSYLGKYGVPAIPNSLRDFNLKG